MQPRTPAPTAWLHTGREPPALELLLLYLLRLHHQQQQRARQSTAPCPPGRPPPPPTVHPARPAVRSRAGPEGGAAAAAPGAAQQGQRSSSLPTPPPASRPTPYSGSLGAAPAAAHPPVPQGSSAQAGPSASQGRGGVRASEAEAAVLNSKVQALADALLLPGRDAAPLEKEGGLGPASYPEADVQALVQGAGSTRREALGALQRHDKQAWPAFKSELARLRINRPLLRELMAEYLEAAGLEAGPARAALPGGSQAAAPSMPSPAASVPGLPSSPRGQDCRLQPGSPCEGGWRSGSGSQGSERGERGSQASPGSSEQGTSRSASQSPPSKVQRRTGSRNPLHRGLSRASSGACHSAEASQEGGRDLDSAAPAATTMTAVPRHITTDPGHQGSAATPPSSTLVPPPLSISQLPALALQGGARALLQAVEALDPGLLPSQPDLHFRLVQARMAELLAAGQCGAAVLMAREQLAPLAEREPSLQGPLK
ncbi:hypothetical protein QJQ45_014214, partial [Haematococcus lacustris]